MSGWGGATRRRDVALPQTDTMVRVEARQGYEGVA